ncbi:MAG: gliding motility-associated C-terminal domain-containing protein [Bacteroidia bacterium]
MKKLYALATSLILLAGSLTAQDIGVVNITSPSSGCSLTSTENVVVKIFNYGTNMSGVPFNVSYTINGGAAVTDVGVVFASFLTNSTVTYTVSTPANLSVPGTYTLTASATTAGDINMTNDAITGYNVTNNAASIGGTISGGGHACKNLNSGSLTLSGNTGSILNWEYSTDGGATYISISNTSNSQFYNNLSVNTVYRAKVQNASCPTAFSTLDSIQMDPVTVPGSISGSTTVCISGNAGNLTSVGKTGTIVNWEFSTNGGGTWTAIANSLNTQPYTNVVVNTLYRAVVQSGVCAVANSSNGTITVSPVTVAGTIAPDTLYACAGVNNGTMTLSGKTGAISRWESSINGGASWSNIVNATVNQTYTNLAVSTIYRSLVKSGACPSKYSDTTHVIVSPVTVPGTLSSNATVCNAANAGTITLAGQTGNIVNWESSVNGGAVWTPIANTTTTENYNNLTTTTLYRASVQSNGCSSAYSDTVTISVDSTSVGGVTSAATTVCSGANAGSLNLAGQTGSVQRWEFSSDGGLTWSPIANITTSNNYTNLTGTTIYQAIVQEGVCPADTSTQVTISVDSTTLGGSVTLSDTVCAGNNNGTLNLSSQRGNIMSWEYSTDGGLTWLSIANATASQSFNNLNTTSMYRALVQNGVCPSSYSSFATITTDQPPVAGTLYGGATVCSGANAGTLTLVGSVGPINNWEFSTDGGATWNAIANTTAFENYTNLVTTTLYQSIVGNGACPNDTSSIATVSVDAVSVGGLITVDDTVCAGANAGMLNLNGNTGNVVEWQFSVDNGTTWIALSNITTSQGYLNLSATTQYRSQIKNGVCPAAYSGLGTITVDQVPVAGTLSGGTTVCSGANAGAIALSGYSGNVIDWQTSTDGGATWTPLGSTATTQNYSNLTSTTSYLSIVGSGVCANDTSSITTINVDSVSVGGMVTVDDTVCAGANAGTVNLTGNTGSVIDWQYSTDGGVSWISLSNTTSSQGYANLVATTLYRTKVKYGVCPSDTSAAAKISVDAVSLASSLSSPAVVCESANNGTLLSGTNTGSILDWESSTDGITWTPIGNATAQQNYLNLTDTTWYHIIVKNGVCSPDTSASLKITVNPKPNAVFAAAAVCEGATMSFINSTTTSSGFIQLYNWDFGDNNSSVSGNPVHLYADSGSYNVSLVALSSLGCLDTFNLPVRVNALPSVVFTASGPLSFCPGDSVTVSVPFSANNTYLWSNGDTLNTTQIDTSGTFSILATDTVSGCLNTDSLSTILFPAPVANAGLDDTLSLGGTINLNGSGGLSYNWTPIITLSSGIIAQPVATPSLTTVYILTITDANGCTASDSVRIFVDDNISLVIPNLITPNGDGHNDVWYIKNINLFTNTEVVIFNRNGQKVFGMTDYDNSWGGTFNGNILPDGTYYYVLKLPDNDKTFKGAITILKSGN